MFDLISPFLITAPELTHKLITLTLSPTPSHPLTVLSHPVSLDSPKYPRNSLLFSVAFAFDGRASDGHRPYHAVLRKLASVIETLERESEFLFQPLSKARLPQLIDDIFQQLSSTGECDVQANAANRIFLRLYPQLPQPPPLRAWDVPVLLRPLDLTRPPGRTWDLTLRTVIPFIDAVSTLALISHRSTIPLPHVHRCVARLMYHRACTTVDPFQFTNAYAPTARLSALHQSAYMQRDGAEYVGGVTGAQLMRLYGGMRWGEDVEGLMKREALNERGDVDVRRLVVYGVMHGIIRRVRVFPMLDGGTSARHSDHSDDLEAREEDHDGRTDIGDDDEEEEEAGEGGTDEREDETASLLRRALQWCDGDHCSDELCYRLGVSYRKLHRALSTDLRVVFIHR